MFRLEPKSAWYGQQPPLGVVPLEAEGRGEGASVLMLLAPCSSSVFEGFGMSDAEADIDGPLELGEL